MKAPCSAREGTVLVEAKDIAAGPGRKKPSVCINCLSSGGQKGLQLQAGWPSCSYCDSPDLHTEEERNLFAKAGLTCSIQDFKAPTDELDFILPLRLLLKIGKNPALKEKLSKLDVKADDSKQRNSRVYGADSDAKIIDTITKKLKVTTSSAEVEWAIALAEKFSMVLDGSRGIVAVYLELAQLTHSCSPNTYHTCWSDRRLLVKAARTIEEGEPITICKVDNAKCTLFRRKLLADALVDCQCPRCLDGSELGTGFSSLLCKSCPGSSCLISSTDPRNPSADWKCSGCSKTTKGSACAAKLESLENKLKEYSHPNDLEKVLLGEGDWGELPGSSGIFYDVRLKLISTYQYHQDFYFSEENFLKVKLAHIEECFGLRNKLCPGWCYPWVMLMFEKMNASVALLVFQKTNSYPIAETNAFISQITAIPNEPVRMLIEEEDPSLLNAFRQSNQIAVEAREEQKTRRLIYANYQDEEDEDYWAGYT